MTDGRCTMERNHCRPSNSRMHGISSAAGGSSPPVPAQLSLKLAELQPGDETRFHHPDHGRRPITHGTLTVCGGDRIQCRVRSRSGPLPSPDARWGYESPGFHNTPPAGVPADRCVTRDRMTSFLLGWELRCRLDAALSAGQSSGERWIAMHVYCNKLRRYFKQFCSFFYPAICRGGVLPRSACRP